MKATAPTAPLDEKERNALLTLSRATLDGLFGPPEDTYERWRASDPPARLFAPGACFVTLMTRADRLRGCIGCLESDEPLAANVHWMTRQAALADPRFPPVRQAEATELLIHVTALGPVEPLPRLEAIEIGRHGLVVEAAGRRGVLLASVAVDFGWGRDEFVAETCRKADLAPELAAQYRWSCFTEQTFAEAM